MPDHETSDREVLALLDRAAEHTPPLHLDRQDVVDRGEQIVRRRRARGAGMTIGGLALAGAVWLGVGVAGDGRPGSLQEAPPASTVSTMLDTELVAADGTAFTLSVEGEDIVATDGRETYPTAVHPEGGPIYTLFGEGRRVLFVPGWDLSSGDQARVGTAAADGTVEWVAPSDVAGVTLADGTPVVALVVEPDFEVFGELQPDGSVDEVTVQQVQWGPVGPGGHVILLGETYEVAVDDQGWPMLLEEDGSTFLTVTDELGPSGGGIVMWRAHWWPWSDRNEVHFRVDGQPALDPGVEGQDAVTISGPAGEVGLVAVPAGS